MSRNLNSVTDSRTKPFVSFHVRYSTSVLLLHFEAMTNRKAKLPGLCSPTFGPSLKLTSGSVRHFQSYSRTRRTPRAFWRGIESRRKDLPLSSFQPICLKCQIDRATFRPSHASIRNIWLPQCGSHSASPPQAWTETRRFRRSSTPGGLVMRVTHKRDLNHCPRSSCSLICSQFAPDH
jgi:hypothetical protein